MDVEDALSEVPGVRAVEPLPGQCRVRPLWLRAPPQGAVRNAEVYRRAVRVEEVRRGGCRRSLANRGPHPPEAGLDGPEPVVPHDVPALVEEPVRLRVDPATAVENLPALEVNRRVAEASVVARPDETDHERDPLRPDCLRSVRISRASSKSATSGFASFGK
ncbi:MAG TPA: hypothetical protein VIM86_10425 [Thermodesulfobacteriota bacterium]